MYAEHDMDMALTEYADYLKADYHGWGETDAQRARIDLANDYDITFQRGQKFIKVVHIGRGNHRSVHSFICIKAHDKWAVGDILKAASWASPAKNFRRGNVLRQEWSAVHWTGA
jgi:hypothetical protein